jgi:hypothetical protein
MFTTEVRREPSWAAWIAQQFAVPLILFLAAVATDKIPKIAGANFEERWVFELWWDVFVFCCGGFILGVLTQWLFPRFASMGLWIWVLPSIGMIAAFISDVRVFPLNEVLSELFYPGPNGEAWWVAMLVTFPSLSCIAYSLAIVVMQKHLVRR